MRNIFGIFLILWIPCIGFAQTVQDTAKALVTEHDNNLKARKAKILNAKSDAEKQLIAKKSQEETLKYAEVLRKQIEPHLRNEWTVPYTAWLIRNHPKLNVEKNMGPNEEPKLVNREDIYMQYFESSHISSSFAGEFVVSLLFRVNSNVKVQARKFSLAEKVYTYHAQKNKEITGAAAYVCGMLTPHIRDDEANRKKMLSYLTTAVRNASDFQVGEFKLMDALTEKFHLINNLEPGRPVPLIAGQDAIGNTHAINDYIDKTVLLIFWSQKINNYQEFAEKVNGMVKTNAGKPFNVLGVTTDDVGLLRQAIGNDTMKWRNFVDVEGKITKEFRAYNQPFCYIIDKTGKIVYRGGLGGPEYFQVLSAELNGE